MATIPVNVVGFNVPLLTDNTIAFVNAAAWNAYWLQGSFTVNMPLADTVNKGLVNQGTTVVFNAPATTATKRYTLQVDLDGTGNLQNVPVTDAGSFDEVKTLLAALLADYQNLKAALKVAGLITNN